MDPLGLLGLALLLGTGARGGAPGGGGAPRPPPTAPKRLPPGAPPPWPQVLPTDLPPFPGSGWEYDEPPAKAVVERAGQLVQALWSKGAGTHKTELTAGRWVTYRAEKVRSGKNGVVAYRIKGASTTATPKPPVKTTPPQAPAAPPEPPPMLRRPEEPQSRSPGLPPLVSPAIMASVSPASPIALPRLKKGAGMKPAAPDPNVVLLQQKLAITADGRFGTGTEAAVKEFQRKAKLVADGIVGAKTWTALFAVRAK